MTNKILFHAHAHSETIDIRTISAKMKSPHRFYITYDELDRLQTEGRLYTADIHSFAHVYLDAKHDRVTFNFTWLTGHSFGRVEGTEQMVHLRWSKFQVFLWNCRLADGPKEYKAISLDERCDRPRLIFDGNKANLRAAVANRHIRHKLGKALMLHFNWPRADEIRLYNDSMPYSFFFRELTDGEFCLCGGLIFHNYDGNIKKASYSLHT